MNKRPYECGEMTVWNMPATHCVFCKHCTGVIWDYTSGPYGYCCEKDLRATVTETEWICEGFEDDGYVFDEEDYKKRLEAYEFGRKLAREKLASDEGFKRMIDDLANKILYGDGGKENGNNVNKY